MRKGILLIIFFIVLLAGSIFLSSKQDIIVGNWYTFFGSEKKSIKTPDTSSQISPTPQRTPNPYPHKYPSLDGKYVLGLSGGDPECTYELRDKDGTLVDLQSLLKTDKIRCYEGPGLSSSFQRWMSGNRVIFYDYKGVVTIADIENMKLIEYPHNGSIYDRFIDVDESLKYWVFHKQNGNFAILDIDNKELKEIIGSYTSYPLYDRINNGILFITLRKVTQDQKNFSQSFHFLDLTDFTMTNVLNTEMNVTPPGMGCYHEKIKSQTFGEIILSQGCSTVRTNKQYLDSSGNIIIKI